MERARLLVFSFCLGCFLIMANAGFQETTGKMIEVKDAHGNVTSLELPVRRIVVLTTDALEILRALQADELVVGVGSDITKNADCWPGMQDKAVVGKWNAPNYEIIAALKPDLVIAYADRPGQELERAMNACGIVVVRLDFYKLASMNEEIASLGRIVGKEKEAAELIRWYSGIFSLIQEKIGSSFHRPRVYIESYSPYRTAGPGSGAHEMCIAAGGYNLASICDIPYADVTPEWVVSQNPEIIVKGAITAAGDNTGKIAELERERESILRRTAWNSIQAVKQGKVLVLAEEIWTGPAAVIGVACMARSFYPELFRDLNPAKIHRDYMATFQRKPYGGTPACPVESGKKNR